MGSLAIEKIINMAAAFVGKFKLASQENFDEYMKAIGVGMAKRAMARAATPVVTYSLNGDEITIVTTSMKDYTSKYTIGVNATRKRWTDAKPSQFSKFKATN